VRAALAFLTPLGGARTPSPRALPWFPVIGALIGAGVGGAWWAGTEVWNPFVGAALAVLADLMLTGMLHIDGLADSADGLLPHLGTKERRLEVMRQPDVGAFGVGAVVGTLLVEVAAFTATDVDVVAAIAVWATVRAAASVAMLSMPYARGDGLASAFRGHSPLAAAAAVVASTGLALVDPVAAIAVALGFLAIVLVAVRRIGGYTGDVLGAGIVVAQVAGMLAVAR
jgi:adenosylcobinamide-GDP ribazoletransferase